MVASFGRFSGLVAATVDVPTEHLDEIVWADLAGWLFQSLAKWRTAYIPVTPTTPEEIEEAPPPVHTLDERLKRIVAPADAASDPLLEQLHRSLEAVFGRAISVPEPLHTDTRLPAADSDPESPTANATVSVGGPQPSAGSDRARRESAGSRQRDRALASRTEVRREFWWDAARKSFEELTRSEVLGQVLGMKRFLAHGFMYSPAGRALQAFAGARIVNRMVYTVDCQDAGDSHGGTSDTPDAAGSSPVKVCSHRRHILRYPSSKSTAAANSAKEPGVSGAWPNGW
jgi:hypothetical protein